MKKKGSTTRLQLIPKTRSLTACTICTSRSLFLISEKGTDRTIKQRGEGKVKKSKTTIKDLNTYLSMVQWCEKHNFT